MENRKLSRSMIVRIGLGAAIGVKLGIAIAAAFVYTLSAEHE